MNLIDELEAFFAVADTLSFTAAGKILRMSQPAVTKKIRNLEEQLSIPLLQRDKKRVILTSEGETLRRRMLPLVKQLKTVIEETQGKTKKVEGLIRIGALIDAGPFVDWALAFHKAYPSTIVQFEFLDNFQILEAIKSGHLDFGVVTQLPDQISIKSYKIYKEVVVLVTRASHRRNPSDFSETEDVPFVRFRFRSPLRSDNASMFSPFFNKYRKSLGIKRHSFKFAVNSFPAMVDVLLASDTFAVMPFHTVAKHIASDQLRLVSDKKIEGDLYLVHHDHDLVELKLLRFREFFRDRAREHLQRESIP